MRIPELLAPAGSEAALHAAVTSGADAVYLGLEEFNARRNADNFTYESFGRACDYAHLRGVGVYVTMNTLILPDEIDSAMAAAKRAYRLGADALIVQDIGLATLIKRDIPELALHISTQMNIHNRYGLEAAASLGAKRVTVAREVSVAELAHLCDEAADAGLEIETFAHGALCVCYSGQCLMSSLIGGRSANRGLCAQACRLPYELTETDNPDRQLRAPGEFLLSPKDLCSIDHIADLARAGVSSLKIEGRMKSPEYVQSVVSVYRAVLDRLVHAEAEKDFADKAVDFEGVAETTCMRDAADIRIAATSDERERLASVFSRGFSAAYLEGERGNEMMSYQRPNNRGQFVGRVKSINGEIAHIQSEVTLCPGDLVEFWTRRGNVTLMVSDSFEQGRKTAYLPLEGLGRDATSVHVQDRVFRIRSASAAFHDDACEPRIPISGHISIVIGAPLRIEFQVESEKAPYAQASAEGPVVEPARSKPLVAEDVYAHVDRLGSTPFYLNDLQIDLEEGAGLGFSQIHHVRADALEKLVCEMLAPYKMRVDAQCASSKDARIASHKKSHKSHRGKSSATSGINGACTDITIAVLATNPDTARAAKRAGADAVYVPALNYRRGQSETAGALDRDVRQAGFPKGCIPIMPVADHDALGACASCAACSDQTDSITANRESAVGFDVWEYAGQGSPVLVDSLAALQHALDIGTLPEIGPHLPITNAASLALADAFGASRIWLSPELNLSQIRSLAEESNVPLGIKVAGAQELMVTEHCLLMSMGPCNQDCLGCARRKVTHSLKDRKGYLFPVVTDAFGRSHLYNAVELDTVAALSDLADAGIKAFMIDATLMDAEACAHATGRLAKALSNLRTGQKPLPKLPNTTSGHLFRGVS